MSSLREIKEKKTHSNKKSGKEGVRFLQTQTNSLFCRIYPNISVFPFCKGDISCHLFLKRGSMTIEASIIVPLFLLASIMVLSIVDVMRISMDNEAELHKLVREAVVYGYLADQVIEGREGDYINLTFSYPIDLPLKTFGLKRVVVKNRCYGHIFNGYNDRAGDQVGETRDYVYITESGSVYHRKRSCIHLNVSVREISKNTILKKRNKDGSIYYACGECVTKGSTTGKVAETVYITDYGIRYHEKINCSELKRTVKVIPLSEAGGKSACKDCGF